MNETWHQKTSKPTLRDFFKIQNSIWTGVPTLCTYVDSRLLDTFSCLYLLKSVMILRVQNLVYSFMCERSTNSSYHAITQCFYIYIHCAVPGHESSSLSGESELLLMEDSREGGCKKVEAPRVDGPPLWITVFHHILVRSGPCALVTAECDTGKSLTVPYQLPCMLT